MSFSQAPSKQIYSYWKSSLTGVHAFVQSFQLHPQLQKYQGLLGVVTRANWTCIELANAIVGYQVNFISAPVEIYKCNCTILKIATGTILSQYNEFGFFNREGNTNL